MALPEPLLKLWRNSPRIAHPRLEIGDDGVTLGKTVLAALRGESLDVDARRIAAIFSVAYGRKFSTRRIEKQFRYAERYFKRRDKVMASMSLALTGVPPADLDIAQRLFAADWAAGQGMTLQMLLKLAGLRKDDSGEGGDEEDGDDASGDGGDDGDGEDSGDGSDFDSTHPRWPAGSPGGIGGEFAPKDAGDATSVLQEAVSQGAEDHSSGTAPTPLDPDKTRAALDSAIDQPSSLPDGTQMAGTNWDSVAKQMGIDPYDFSDALHDYKARNGLGPADNIQLNPRTGQGRFNGIPMDGTIYDFVR